jgi:hypothetical protein
MAFKESLLQDIIHNPTGYWLSKELILKELEQLIQSPFSCLTDPDRLALRARFGIMEAPEANGINVNMRGGI